jgi:hypothetical protein
MSGIPDQSLFLTTQRLVGGKGHKIPLDDAASRIQLPHSGGGEITLHEDGITLTIGATSSGFGRGYSCSR